MYTVREIIRFSVNGNEVEVINPDPSWLLVDFLREKLYLTGPKKPCGEGGCGGCTIVMQMPADWVNPKSPEMLSFNSCLRRVVQCEGQEFFTTEYFADTSNPEFQDNGKFTKIEADIPRTIAFNNGSQCGYCTSGFVSNLAAYCANTEKADRTIIDIENLFDGNLCRCTGFRPILFGAKTLAKGDNAKEAEKTPSLVTSELNYYNGGLSHANVNVVKKRVNKMLDRSPAVHNEITQIIGDKSIWYSGFKGPESLFRWIDENIPLNDQNFKKVKFVGANSSSGIYKQKECYDPKYLLDTTSIKAMRILMKEETNCERLIIGAGCTIAMLHNKLRQFQKGKASPFIEQAADNIERVASTILRNIVSIGGNIAMEAIFGFGSDLVNSLYVLGTVLTVYHQRTESPECFTIPQFLDFTKKNSGQLFLIVSLQIDMVELNAMNHIGVGCYKVAKRFELSHAIVNGGCLIAEKDNKLIARVGFTLAREIHKEDYTNSAAIIPFCEYPVTMKEIRDTKMPLTLSQLKTIHEVFTNENETIHHSESLKKQVVLANQIFEKFLLQIYYLHVSDKKFVSAYDVEDLFHKRRTHPSSGEQRFSVYNMEASEPIVKADALIQAQGHAFYTWNNHNLNQNVLHANFLTSIYGFRPFYVDEDLIRDHFPGIEVLTGESVCRKLGDDAVNTAHDPVSDDLYVQCSGAEKQPMAGSRWLAKDYTQFAGQAVALLLSEDETALANAIASIQNKHEDYVHYKSDKNDKEGKCTLYRKTECADSSVHSFKILTTAPVVTIDESRDLGLALKASASDLTKVTSPNINYKDPSIDWDSFENCEIMEGEASTGGQIHMYMEPQSCIAEPLDNGGIQLLCSTQCPISIQTSVAQMLHLPSWKVVVRVIRLGGGFGGKTVQSATTALAACAASRYYARQIRVALDRNTDMTITGGRHPYFGTFKAAITKDSTTPRIEALQMDYQCIAGYSQDCSLIVGAVALANSFNCYHFPTYYANVRAYYTNTVSNTAFRTFGVIQAQFLLESVFESLADQIAVSKHTKRYESFKNFEEYEKEVYQQRFELRKAHFLKDNDQVPYARYRTLQHVNTERIWDELCATYQQCCEKARKFNRQSLTKKMGVGIMPMMYAISFNIPSLMQGEASVSIKTDGSVLLILGCVDMGQGISTKLTQLVAQKLKIPFSFVAVAELTTNTPPNQVPTGASTGTDLNGAAVAKAAHRAYLEINRYCKRYWECLSRDPESKTAKQLFAKDKEIQKQFIKLSTTSDLQYQYPDLWINHTVATAVRKSKKAYDKLPSQENKEKYEAAKKQFEETKAECSAVWRALCAQLENDRATLLYSAHSNVEGVSAIDPETGKGDPDMYQTYAAAVSLVEVDMLTGEVDFLKAHILFDAGESLNPAIDIGQVEGGFIQGVGLMTSEEVNYSPDGFQITNTTWEYKPCFAKSIPRKFIVDMYPSKKIKHQVHDIESHKEAMRYRKSQRKRAHGVDAGVMSSKSTGEPPVVMSISVFQAIRDALRAHQDYLYRNFSPEQFPKEPVISFTQAPATVSRIQDAIQHIGKSHHGSSSLLSQLS